MTIETISYAGKTPSVELTPFRKYGFRVEGGTSYDMGLFVEARVDGILICRQFVHADYVYEPSWHNAGGTIGAYRSVYPAEFKITHAKVEIEKKAAKILSQQLLAQTYDGNVWLTPKQVRKLNRAYYGDIGL